MSRVKQSKGYLPRSYSLHTSLKKYTTKLDHRLAVCILICPIIFFPQTRLLTKIVMSGDGHYY